MSTTTMTASAPSTPMPSGVKVTQARVLAFEWVKFRSLRSPYIALAATFVVMVGFDSLFAAVVANRWPSMKPAEQAHIDPTGVSLRGVFLAQTIIGVLGVLVVTGEYSTGMIRASLSAAPTRLPVLWAKIGVFAVVSFVVCTVGAFAAFFAGQAFLSGRHINTSLSAPGVFRAVIGAGLYLTVVGLLGVALGLDHPPHGRRDRHPVRGAARAAAARGGAAGQLGTTCHPIPTRQRWPGADDGATRAGDARTVDRVRRLLRLPGGRGRGRGGSAQAPGRLNLG